MSYLKTAEGGSRRAAPEVLANTEEFPPLGGGSRSGGTPTTPNIPVQPQQMPGGSGSSQTQQPQPSQEPAPQQDAEGKLGKFGLDGILEIIRMTDPDLNTLALGYDLTTLGLSLNSPEPLYSTLCCPWSDAQSAVQPEYRLPTCYSLQPPHLRFQMFQRFHLETLFYIFYSMPRDVLQLAAAQELYNREWRFHKTHKLWFMREAQPSVKQATYERGNYYVFEPQKWKKERRDDFVLVYDQLEEKTAMAGETKQPQQQALHTMQQQQQQMPPQNMPVQQQQF